MAWAHRSHDPRQAGGSRTTSIHAAGGGTDMGPPRPLLVLSLAYAPTPGLACLAGEPRKKHPAGRGAWRRGRVLTSPGSPGPSSLGSPLHPVGALWEVGRGP